MLSGDDKNRTSRLSFAITARMRFKRCSYSASEKLISGSGRHRRNVRSLLEIEDIGHSLLFAHHIIGQQGVQKQIREVVSHADVSGQCGYCVLQYCDMTSLRICGSDWAGHVQWSCGCTSGCHLLEVAPDR
jgi:hypothetical protein